MSDLPGTLPPIADDGMTDDGAVTPRAKMLIEARIRDCVKRSEGLATKYRGIGGINERFCIGDQWGSYGWREGKQDGAVAERWDARIPKIAINKLANLVLTWAALLTADQPTVTAVPTNDSVEAYYQAEVTQNLIRYLSQELETAGKIHEAVLRAAQHGTAGLKIIWNAQAGRVEWEPLTIFNYYIDCSTPDYTKAQWVVFENFIPLHEAKDMHRRAGIGGAAPKEERYRNAANEEIDGVRVFECWHKPDGEDSDFPRGFFATMCDDKLVEAMPYPHVFEGEGGKEYLLPCALMKMRKVRDSAYGYTNVSDCIEPQRQINDAASRIAAAKSLWSKATLFLPKQLKEVFSLSDDNITWFDQSTLELVKASSFLKGYDIPQVLFDERDYYAQQMNDIMGVSVVTSGVEQRSISGRAIQNTAQLDTQKNIDAKTSMEDMIEQAWDLTLKLEQRYVTEERLVTMSKRSGADVFSFLGADLKGADIRLEPSSELDQQAMAMQARDAEAMASGVPTDAQGRQMRMGGAIGREQASAVMARILAGEEVDTVAEAVDLEALAQEARKTLLRARQAKDEQRAQIAINVLQAIASQAAMQPGPIDGPGDEQPPRGATA